MSSLVFKEIVTLTTNPGGSKAPCPYVNPITPNRVGLWATARKGERSYAIRAMLNQDFSVSLDKYYKVGPLPETPMDFDGVMPSCFRASPTKLLYAGWNKGTEEEEIRYRTCCLEYSWAGRKALIDRLPETPYGTSMPHAVDDQRIYFMGYLGWFDARLVRDRKGGEPIWEPYYDLFVLDRETNDVMHLSEKDIKIPDLIDADFAEDFEDLEELKCRARPVMFLGGDDGCPGGIYYCERFAFDFRNNQKKSYKLKAANSSDNFDIIIKSSEDHLMEAYGYPIEIDGKTYLFYNTEFNGPIKIAVFEGAQ